jgi:hypothetical protein
MTWVEERVGGGINYDYKNTLILLLNILPYYPVLKK